MKIDGKIHANSLIQTSVGCKEEEKILPAWYLQREHPWVPEYPEITCRPTLAPEVPRDTGCQVPPCANGTQALCSGWKQVKLRQTSPLFLAPLPQPLSDMQPPGIFKPWWQVLGNAWCMNQECMKRLVPAERLRLGLQP